MSDLYSDPLGTAVLAAAKIAEITGKPKHDVALVMGSGWMWVKPYPLPFSMQVSKGNV